MVSELHQGCGGDRAPTSCPVPSGVEMGACGCRRLQRDPRFPAQVWAPTSTLSQEGFGQGRRTGGCRAGVPSLFGTKDGFHGRQFLPQIRAGVGGVVLE